MKAYFFFGDVLSLGLTGALTGLACVQLIGVGWNMVLAMLLGMAAGMVLAMPMAIGLGIWFGAFELMLPSMLGGMMSGMAVAMWEAHSGVGLAEAALVGAIWSWAALLATYLADAALRGEVQP